MAEELHILIIDDDEIDRLTIKRSLQKAGVSATLASAETATAGLQLLATQTFDCIFIDFKLPDMDGLNLLKKIRQKNADVPVLLVTSYGDERVAAEAIKMGASDYISKNQLTPEGISQSLRNALRLHQIELQKQAAEKNLLHTQQQLNTIISNTPIVIWAIDKEGIYTLSTGKGLEILGRKTNEVVGKSVFEVYAQEPELLKDIQLAIAGKLTKSTLEINGNYFETLYQPVRDKNGEISGVTGLSFDITDRMKSEKALQKAKELAEQSVKVKEQFFTNMSHEIRTPMNGIIGLTGVLQKMEMTEEQRTYLDAIRTSSERLLVIVNDLLDFSKIEAGKIALEETSFNFRDLIANTVKVLSPKAEEKNNRLKIIIDPQIPEEIAGDPVRLSQILNNLLGNAIKFTNNGQIRLLADNVKEIDDAYLIEFEIQDTGIGIPEDKLASIFESFTQASNDTTRKFGGTGLGLTISRQLIEMQGGTLAVRSKLNEGSTFTFSILFKKATRQNTETKQETTELEIDPAELGPVRILMAEDNKINQLLAKKVILDWGFELDIAENGRIAIDMLKENDYDLVLMDMQMPEMDGYEATVYIRNEMGAKSNIPIIAFTAHATKMEIGKCMLAGANAYVSKPFKPEELLSEIYDQVSKEPGVVFKPILEPEAEINDDDLGEVNIDLTFLKEMAGGNAAFMEEIIDMFIKTTPESLEKMQEALIENDLVQVKAIAHRLKSSMFLVGINELEMNMATIEQHAQNPEERKLVERLLSRTQRICQLVIRKLKPAISI